MMKIETWFPTVIGYDNYDIDIQKYRDIIDNDVKNHPELNHKLSDTEHWSGFNDSRYVVIQNDPIYSDLVACINKSIQDYSDAMQWDTQTQPFKIMRMWSNVYEGKQVARIHHHTGVLSGCFYLDEGHEVVFSSPFLNTRPENLHSQLYIKDLNHLNINDVSYKSEPGKCLLWPSWMMHETRKDTSFKTRSIAFDVWFFSDKNYYLPPIDCINR